MNRQKIRKTLFYILPFALFFADFPKIDLADVFNITSMNIELSALILYLVVFGLISLPDIWNYLLKNRKNKAIIASAIFMLYMSASIIWSPNKTRAILTTGVAWVIFCSIISILEIFSRKEKPNKVLDNFLIAGLGASALAILQMILDIFKVDRSITQLCTGCVYSIFGFPHANGFFAEPQFFGNILAVLAITANYLFINQKGKKYLIFSLVYTTTLFLTLSRGAIYSFVLASAVFGIVELCKKNLQILKLAGTGVLAFILALTAQGIMSQLSPTSDTFTDGIRKPVEQLSLGKIKPKDLSPINTEETTEDTPQESHFEGYVAQSTDVRTLLNTISMDTWKKRPMFGVGIGGAGQAIYNNYSEKQGEITEDLRYWGLDTPKIITQNTYTEVLLELGLVGSAILATTLFFIIREVSKAKSKVFFYIYAVFAGASICFFSGITNAIHLYILPALIRIKHKK